jgi:hypothetical protein
MERWGVCSSFRLDLRSHGKVCSLICLLGDWTIDVASPIACLNSPYTSVLKLL